MKIAADIITTTITTTATTTTVIAPTLRGIRGGRGNSSGSCRGGGGDGGGDFEGGSRGRERIVGGSYGRGDAVSEELESFEQGGWSIHLGRKVEKKIGTDATRKILVASPAQIDGVG